MSARTRIMVDDLVAWPLPRGATAQARRAFGGKQSCHLTIEGSDLEPLHAFAARIGLKREWFQDHRVLPHYDLTPRRRASALAAGAVYVSAREQARARRAARSPGGSPSVPLAERWKQPYESPLQISDTRNERWKAAEARIAGQILAGDEPHHDDLAIVDEEQAAYDRAHPPET